MAELTSERGGASQPDPDIVAALLPSGIIRRFALTDFYSETVEGQSGCPGDTVSTISFDTPTGEIEEQRASLLASHIKVSPVLARVIERGANYLIPTDRQAKLPPGKRVVFVPVPEDLAS
ncbi:hypothetical protein COY17_03030 [Candidatus Saccharibacteria bacterium CG_4_10_14_0_2_um_filter_52_9]|nr:MAG: hypothetical protein COY17_03030 [Candidatus Saccharibacteria bacterium CG_4_10_14_0_2_um_filter_52_9]